jgi:hypothetical protein
LLVRPSRPPEALQLTADSAFEFLGLDSLWHQAALSTLVRPLLWNPTSPWIPSGTPNSPRKMRHSRGSAAHQGRPRGPLCESMVYTDRCLKSGASLRPRYNSNTRAASPHTPLSRRTSAQPRGPLASQRTLATPRLALGCRARAPRRGEGLVGKGGRLADSRGALVGLGVLGGLRVTEAT